MATRTPGESGHCSDPGDVGEAGLAGWMQVLEKGHQSLLILGKGLCVFGSSDPKISCFGQELESSRTGRGREGEKEEGGILKTGSLQGQVTVREVGKEGSGVRV